MYLLIMLCRKVDGWAEDVRIHGTTKGLPANKPPDFITQIFFIVGTQLISHGFLMIFSTSHIFRSNLPVFDNYFANTVIKELC